MSDALDDLYTAIEKALRTPSKRFFPVDEYADWSVAGKPKRKKLQVKSLTGTQRSIHAGFRAQKNPSTAPISVYRSPKGKHYIIEGHHRTARAAVRGDKHITANVYRAPRIKKSAAELAEAIEKAGLIKPGKPSLLRRIGFLLGAARNDRKAGVARYLEGRKRGLGYGPKLANGKRRGRKGTYTGVYATGVNKSESVMSDAIGELYEAVEKARVFRGVKMSAAQRRLVAGAGSNYRQVWRERGRSNFMQGGRRGRAVSVDGRQAKTTPSSVQRGVKARLRVRKSEQPMTDATDELYEAIEKATGKGLIRGSSSAARARILLPGGKRSKLKRYLGDRRHGGKVAAGSKGERYQGYYESRRGKYK